MGDFVLEKDGKSQTEGMNQSLSVASAVCCSNTLVSVRFTSWLRIIAELLSVFSCSLPGFVANITCIPSLCFALCSRVASGRVDVFELTEAVLERNSEKNF